MTDKITALLGSRICHDLISPLGAIGNGMELLSMGTDAALTPEMRLINDSVNNANARIRFFRIAFGSASAGQTVAATEVAGILHDLAVGGRITYEWTPSGPLDRSDVRIICLCILCAEAALPYGGAIHVTLSGENWTVGATGREVRIDDRLWASLAVDQPSPTLTPADVQFGLLAQALANDEKTMTFHHSKNELSIRI